MKTFLAVLFFNFLMIPAFTQQTTIREAQPDSTRKILIVEASCGQCRFHMPGKGCNLAVRINGKTYFVDGTTIDDHGDAHATDGFCETVRKASVQGEIVNNRFKASYFKLIKPDDEGEPKNKEER